MKIDALEARKQELESELQTILAKMHQLNGAIGLISEIIEGEKDGTSTT